MAVTIAEYLGQRVDIDTPAILPEHANNAQCPFVGKACSKLIRGNKPICSVRKGGDELWIVCPDRLCSTTRQTRVDGDQVPITLSGHQQDILWSIAKTIYRGTFTKNDIAVSREVPIPLEDGSSTYHADYVMRNLSIGAKIDEILLEIQGGGETSNTGSITRKVTQWEADENRSNEFLRETVSAGTIETNAWRRQQEQFLVKGNVVSQTGGKIVFAVGSLLYNYLEQRFVRANLRDLREHNWTLCILAFAEDKSNEKIPGPIPLKIDEERLLFTNYSTFVRFLTDQGGPNPQMFDGSFETLEGNTVDIQGIDININP
ncbi:hypothetical protein OAL44_00665 [Planctomycetaceae bacterium]|nr:hypothetical protein [Planctomycetaceae bacterium]